MLQLNSKTRCRNFNDYFKETLDSPDLKDRPVCTELLDILDRRVSPACPEYPDPRVSSLFCELVLYQWFQIINKFISGDAGLHGQPGFPGGKGDNGNPGLPGLPGAKGMLL